MDERFSWDTLIVGGTVLPMTPGSEPIPNGAVAVADGRIASVGPCDQLLEKAPTCEVLEATDCLVLPGFVNTHSHLAMTLMRGLADDLPLKEWLEQHIWPTERSYMNRDTVRLGTELAAAEQLLAGVTTTTDMYFFGEEVCEVLEKTGMRGVVSETLIDFATPRCASQEEMLEKQKQLIERYRDASLITPAVAAHAPYSVCAANLVKVAELAEENDIPMLIHLSETRWEVEQLLQEKGVSPVAYLADIGVLGEKTIAAHCVHLSPDDIEILAEHEVGVAHIPAANLKLASGIAPVPAMLDQGVKVGIGTDGAASNNTLDVLQDMQLMALLQKGVAGDPTVFPARRAVELATREGARVLGLDDRVGSLVEGLEADLICISTKGAHAAPIYDPFSHLVYAARSSDVRHVLVAGKLLVRDRQLETVDVEDVTARAREFAQGLS
jgi:5-methylthioadenosine/S-adenosylhomocysteine deaminase